MELTFKNIIDEQGRLETDRKQYEDLKNLCVQLTYPDRGDIKDWYDACDKGKLKTSRRLYDSTAILARETWSNGIMGLYMPKGINWFAEQMSDRKLRESKRVITWLQENDEHMRFTLAQSGAVGTEANYYSQELVAINDRTVIGDSFMHIEEDDDTHKLMFQTSHPREFWMRRDFWGRIMCIHHKFVKTKQQIFDEFGPDGLSLEQRETLENTKDQVITVIHGIYKNTDYMPDKIGVNNMRWRHYYCNKEAKLIMAESGSQTLNPVPSSLYRPSQEDYGRGMISSMLIEILTANIIGKDMLTASGVAVQPPMLMPAALRHKIDLRQGAKNFFNRKENEGVKAGDMVARLIDSSGYPFGVEQHQRWQQMINDRLRSSLFTSLQQYKGSGKTAFEINQMKAEQAILMSSFLGMLDVTTDSEFDRIYEIELNSGRAPEVPQEVLDTQNQRIDIQHIGPLGQLLKQYYQTGSLLTTLANIKEVLQVFPDSGIVCKDDELMRKIMQSSNAPEELILSSQEVMEIKAIAQQQNDQQLAMMQMQQAAAAVPNLSKKIEPGSILQEMSNAA